jgi:hypothetical protein
MSLRRLAPCLQEPGAQFPDTASLLVHHRDVLFGPVWNKKLVNKEVRSWFDLIDPALRDLVLLADNRASSSGLDTWKGLKSVIGLDFFEMLWETTGPTLFTRSPETQQKLASGERGLAFLQLAGWALEAWREDSSTETCAGATASCGQAFAELMVSQEAAQLLLERPIWRLNSGVTYPGRGGVFLGRWTR